MLLFPQNCRLAKKLNESCPEGGGVMEALCSVFSFDSKFLLCFKKNEKVEEENCVDNM